MILFKCIKCGAVIDAQDEYVGCQAACTYCGTEQEIPAESDPSCVLVFTESSPATGTPMTAAELHVRIDEGTVRPSDLIWSDGMWQPLNAVFELPEQKEGEGGAREDIPELATAFEELPPLDGAEKLPRLRHRKGRAGGAAAMVPEEAPSGRGAVLRRHGKTALAVLVLLIGFFCALKVVNASMGRTATLVVRNDTDEKVSVALPGGKKIDIAPGSSTVATEIAVAVQGSGKITYAAGEEGARQTMNVTLAPKCVTVAGLGEAQFPVLVADFDQAALVKRAQEACQVLRQQLASGEAPEALGVLCVREDQLLKDALVEYSPRRFFTEKDYRLDFYLASASSSVRPFKPAAEGDRRKILLPPTGGQFVEQGDKFTFSGELKLVNATVAVKDVSATIAGGYGVAGGGVLTLARGARNDIDATLLVSSNAKVTLNGRDFTGRWCLDAHCTGGNWRWEWRLLPGTDPKAKPLLLAAPGQRPRLP